MDDIVREIADTGNWADVSLKRRDLLDYNSLMEIGIEAGNRIRSLMILTLGSLTQDEHIRGQETFGLCDAVIVGHLVRIYKLYDQLVYFVSENKGEISQIFSRLQFETYVMMKYLIMMGEPSIRNFIKSSFQSTIKQYTFIRNIEKQRKLIDIEERIVRKIEHRIKTVGLDIMELQQTKKWKLDGMTFKDILAFLTENDPEGINWEVSYGFIYGSGSAFVHGTWYDLEINQLTSASGRYLPKYTYDEVDPRYIGPNSLIAVSSCLEFLKWRGSDPDKFLTNTFIKIERLLTHLEEVDETRIKKREESNGSQGGRAIK